MSSSHSHCTRVHKERANQLTLSIIHRMTHTHTHSHTHSPLHTQKLRPYSTKPPISDQSNNYQLVNRRDLFAPFNSWTNSVRRGESHERDVPASEVDRLVATRGCECLPTGGIGCNPPPLKEEEVRWGGAVMGGASTRSKNESERQNMDGTESFPPIR